MISGETIDFTSQTLSNNSAIKAESTAVRATRISIRPICSGSLGLTELSIG